MLSLNNIKPDKGSRKKATRVGRWNGSGLWSTSGRWNNGQNQRSGWWVAPWFEWGQTPLFRRLPKLKGFSNALFKNEFNIINLKDLEKLASTGIVDITVDVLLEKGLVRNKRAPLKVLANGELTKKINVVCTKISDTAKSAIEKNWGKVEII